MLEAEGLITLNEDVEKTEATLEDIKDNPKKLKFDTEYEASLLPQIYNNGEGDAVLINSNYAIDAGLNPLEDSIAIEDKESPYANVIAVRSGDEEKEGIKALVEVLRSKEIQDFILEKYEGAVVPVSE
jgi:D-methionine transport system substrate-binding protein